MMPGEPSRDGGRALIRGGTLVDGTGSPARLVDVRVRDGLIVEVGCGLRPGGEADIDAGGCVVAPGFIDTHTHLDPTLFWDSFCDPMPLHGVTTVLTGNCSLSLAPVRPTHRALLAEVFCYFEDLSRAVFAAAIPDTWSDFREYLDAASRQGLGLDVASLVGHTPIRMFVMGDDAWQRSATPAEAIRIAEVLDDCLRDGAFGLSTSLGFDEHPVRGPVPSRLADDAELALLFDCLAARERLLQFIPTQGVGMRQDIQRVADLTGPRGVTSTWIGVFDYPSRPDLAIAPLDFAAGLQAAGIRSYPQVSPRTLDVRVNWMGGMSFRAFANGWDRFIQADAAEKARLIVDNAWRSIAREKWDAVAAAAFPHRSPERIRLIEGTGVEAGRFVGGTLADLIAARGGHPSDVLADWVLDNNLSPGVVGVGVANADPDRVAATLTHPAAIISNSDAGAHLAMMCGAGDSTLLLTRHVRDRGDLTLEAAVEALTRRQAELLGLTDRGVVEAGKKADLVVFDLENLEWCPDLFTTDLPARGSRLRRGPGGYRATFSAGVPVQIEGQDTGARPGGILRSSTRP